jgi:hypothetical protein
MKVKFCCDSGANIHSERSETVDTVIDLGMEEGEWEEMTDDQKYKVVEEWARERMEIYWKEEE